MGTSWSKLQLESSASHKVGVGERFVGGETKATQRPTTAALIKKSKKHSIFSGWLYLQSDGRRRDTWTEHRETESRQAWLPAPVRDGRVWLIRIVGLKLRLSVANSRPAGPNVCNKSRRSNAFCSHLSYLHKCSCSQQAPPVTRHPAAGSRLPAPPSKENADPLSWDPR